MPAESSVPGENQRGVKLKQNNPGFVYYGDVVSFYVEELGYLASPSNREPLPEKSDCVSHLRITPVTDAETTTPDFSVRCYFKILGDKGQIKCEPILYGSIVHLVHITSDFTVSASSNVDRTGDVEPYSAVNLRKITSHFNDPSCQWCILPRFRLRVEGDSLRLDDFIVFRSVKIKNNYLTCVRTSNDSTNFDHLIGIRHDAFTRSGWQIKQIASIATIDQVDDSIKIDKPLVLAGDHVRLLHQEVKGNLIARCFDSTMLQNTISPLGLIHHQLQKPVEDTHGIFVRCNDNLEDYVVSGIWQLVPVNPLKIDCVRHGSLLRLRHLLTGNYLCIRQSLPTDSKESQQHSINVENDRAIKSMKSKIFDPSSLSLDAIQRSLSQPAASHINEKPVTPPINQTTHSIFHSRSYSNVPLHVSTTPPALYENWTLCLSPSPDIHTVFEIYSLDVRTQTGGDSESSLVGGGGDGAGGGATSGDAGGDSSLLLTYDQSIRFFHTLTKLTLELKKDQEPQDNKKDHSCITSSNIFDEDGGDVGTLTVREEEEYRKPQWWEYAADQIVRPRKKAEMAKGGEVYLMKRVDPQEVKELLYAIRYLPLVREAIHSIQQTDRLENLYLPTFRHFNIALFTLFQWINGKTDSDFALLNPPSVTLKAIAKADSPTEGDAVDSGDDAISVDESPIETVFTMDAGDANQSQPRSNKAKTSTDKVVAATLSTMAVWIGRPPMSYTRKEVSEAVSSVPGGHAGDPRLSSVGVIRARQRIVSDCRLMDLLMYFTSIVSTLQKNDNISAMEQKSSIEVPTSHTPWLVLSSGKLIQEIMHVFLRGNRQDSLRVLSIKGSIVSMIALESYGWHPPIETVLISSQLSDENMSKDKDLPGNNSINAAELLVNIVSKHDLFVLIDKMHELHINNDSACLPLIRLLTTLCCPGVNPNKALQDILLNVLLETEEMTSSIASRGVGEGGHSLSSDSNRSLLFCTRYSAHGTWEVQLKPHSRPRLKNARDDAVEKYALEEFRDLKFFFSNYRHSIGGDGEEGVGVGQLSPSSGSLDKQGVVDLLAGLCLAGPRLFETVRLLKKCTFPQLNKWWWQNRRHYFTHTSAALDDLSMLEISAICGFEINPGAATAHPGKSTSSFFSMGRSIEPSYAPSAADNPHRKQLATVSPDSAVTTTSTPHTTEEYKGSGSLFSWFGSSHKATLTSEASPKAVKYNLEDDEEDEEKSISNHLNPILRRQLTANNNMRAIIEEEVEEETAAAEGKGDSTFHGVLSTIEGSIQSTFTKLEDAKSKQSDSWQNIMTILDKGSFERDWFHHCLLLLAELCKGCNLFAQHLISKLIPAEMLLDMLSGSLDSDEDKQLCCRLLLYTFVKHDFVFASAAITADQANVLAIDESTFQPRTMAGKAFNQLARFPFSNMRSGSALRLQLWQFLRSEVVRLKLGLGNKVHLEYQQEFFSLLHSLLEIGFFGDSDEYLELENSLFGVTPATTSCCSCCASLTCCSKKKKEVKGFNETVIEEMIVEKLHQIMDHHRTDFNALSDGILEILEESNTGSAAGVEQIREVTSRLAGMRGKPLGLENYSLSSRYFDRVFNDALSKAIVYSIINILIFLYERRQLTYSKQILGILSKNEVKLMKKKRKSKNDHSEVSSPIEVEDDKGDVQPFIKLSKTVRNEIDALFTVPISEKYTKAVLSSTLFQDRELHKKVYYLLRLQISERADIRRVIRDLSFVTSAVESEVQRLSLLFHKIVIKCAHELLIASNPLLTPTCTMTSIDFCLKSVHALSVLRPKKYFDVTPNETTMKMLLMRKRRKSHSLSVIHAVDPGVDGLGEDISKVNDEITGSTRQLLPFTSEEIVFDGFTFLLVATKSIIAILLKLTHVKDNTTVKSWSELTDPERNMLDKVFQFLSVISATECTDIHDQLLAVLKTILSYQEDVCLSAEVLLERMILRCNETSLNALLTFSEKMLDRQIDGISAVARGYHARPQCVRVLLAVLQADASTSSRYWEGIIVQRFTEDILQNGSMIKYIILDTTAILFSFRHSLSALPPPVYDLNLQLLTLCTKLIDNRTIEMEQSLRTLFTAEYCRSVIASTTSYQIKTCILKISSVLYDYQTVPHEDLFMNELLRLKALLVMEDLEVLENLIPPIKQYICEGIIPVLTISLRNCRYAEFEEVDNFIDSRKEALRSEGVLYQLRSLFHKNSISFLLSTEQLYVGLVKQELFLDCVSKLFDVLVQHNGTLLAACLQNKSYSLSLVYLFAASTVMYEKTIVKALREKEVGRKFREMFNIVLTGFLMTEENEEKEIFRREDILGKYLGSVDAYLLTSADRSTVKQTDRELFEDSQCFVPSLPTTVLKASTWFRVLQELLDNAADFLQAGGSMLLPSPSSGGGGGGGGGGTHSEVKNKDVSGLNRTSDLDLWLLGGGRILSQLMSFLGALSSGSEEAYILLHLLNTLLVNTVAEIREYNVPLKRRLSLVEAEVKRLQRLQNTLHSFGATHMLCKIIGGTYKKNYYDPYFCEFVPIALMLAESLVDSGNDFVQEAFMRIHREASKNFEFPTANAFVALKYILRKCNTKIERISKKTSDLDIRNLPLKIAKNVFSFCSSLCGGHNHNAQEYLRVQDRSLYAVNVIQDLAITQNIILQALHGQMIYITYQQFYDRVAPFVWPFNNAAKRRFIAWHDRQLDLRLVAQLLRTAEEGFHTLTEVVQGPCEPNQKEVLAATQYCPALLEFVSLVHLKVTDVIPGTINRTIVWKGGNPIHFLKTYQQELGRIGRFSEDPESYKILGFIEEVNKHAAKNGGFFKDHFKAVNEVLGFQMEIFRSICSDVETSCLRFLLAILEGSSLLVCDTLVGQVDDGILLQNMDNLYHKSFTSRKHQEVFKNSAVSYLTLISTLADAKRSDPNERIDDILDTWKLDCAAKGRPTESMIASVEIVGFNQSVQRVFFPIPLFVLKYWPYPETQKAKETLIWEVNRDSAEEKVANYFDRMTGLNEVMRRQERLRTYLTPLFHMIFGGRSFAFLRFLRMRTILLVFTLILNIYVMYEIYLRTYGWVQPQGNYNYFMNWEYKYTAGSFNTQIIIFSTHTALAGSVALREFMNSPAADNIAPMTLPYENRFTLIWGVSKILGSVYSIFRILSSIWWELTLLGFSLLALFYNRLWYAPCILDIIPQLRMMLFLVESVKRNATKIGFSLIMAFVLLYLFAVLNFLFFKNQYDFNGHADCDDLASCLKLHIDFGLNSAPNWHGTGYIAPFYGSEVNQYEYGVVGSAVIGTFYNLVYIILINLVLQAIISGLIIDTFGDMRAANEAIEADVGDRCFICSISRDEFEQAQIQFENHVKEEHNMWKYLWFKIYLDSKDPLSFSGPEHYAYNHLKDRQAFVSLCPIKKSLTLERRAAGIQKEFTIEAVLVLLGDLMKSQETMYQTVNDVQSGMKTQSQLLKKVEDKANKDDKWLKILEKKLNDGEENMDVLKLQLSSLIEAIDTWPK